MKSPKHVMGKKGCRRCALHASDNHGNCPPGYWMTRLEIVKWQNARTYAEQNSIEREAASLRTTSDQPESK